VERERDRQDEQDGEAVTAVPPGKQDCVELYQAEWCPHSHRVRQRLTELGVSFVARQVAAEPGERAELQRMAGTNEIPVLVADDGETVCGEGDILAWLARFDERADADAHREKSRLEVPEFEP
jgi:glutathione S-transferase